MRRLPSLATNRLVTGLVVLPSRGRVGGFTVVDVLVSIAVIAVLISILMPSLSLVRETTRRLVCASNVRQHGLGLAMYAEDYQGVLPSTIFMEGDAHRLSTVRASPSVGSHMSPGAKWDGLGRLFEHGYLDAPGVYYCPSYRGEHKLDRYAPQWAGEPGEIVANYHYRGRAPGRSELTLFSRPTIAVAADSMHLRSEFSHTSGANVLRIDLAVTWYADSAGRLVAQLPSGSEPGQVASRIVGEAWRLLDQTAPVSGSH